MKSESKVQASAVLAIALVLLLSVMDTSAAEVWSEIFDDLDEWTGDTDDFIVTNGYLECTVENIGSMGSKIFHDSTVNSGTWRCDLFHAVVSSLHIFFWASEASNPYTTSEPIYFIWLDGVRFRLYRNSQELILWGADKSYSGTWTHLDVTMDESFNINVFVNGTHRIHYQTLDPMATCLYFGFGMNQIGLAADNVTVSDSIDIPGNTTTTTTTTTTPTSTPTTPTTTPTTPPPLPIEMIALVGGAAVVVVVLVIFMRRR